MQPAATPGRRRRTLARAVGLALALVAAPLSACGDLDVSNPNEPDRVRAGQLPATVESFAEGAFRSWWRLTHDESPVWIMSTMADEFTAAFLDFGIYDASQEPRRAWNNSPVYGDQQVAEDPWYDLYAMISTVNDALAAIDRGLVITSGTDTVTRRAEAVAKFMQAVGHGYIALYFDQGYIVDERTDLTALRPTMRPYPEVRDSAIMYMRQAIALADANAFTLPATGWFHQSMTNVQLARLGHSFIARFLAYTPRTRAERDGVDWSAVLTEATAGVTTDFAPTAVVDVIFDDFKRVAARTRGSGSSFIPGDFARVDYWLVGPADSTDRFRQWVAKPLAERTRFQIITKDRRISPAGNPSGQGSYLGYSNTNRFQDARGFYNQSNYYFHRWGTGTSWQSGPQVALPVVEMNLLRAEALIRLNRAAEALPLINATRVARGGLDAVTIDGPPDVPGCVPRKLSGACGSLWDALRYEKRIEMIGVEGDIAYFDARGWQTLVQGTFVQLPVPGRELNTIGLPNYTFGGDQPSAAPAPEPERCPVALPRCP